MAGRPEIAAGLGFVRAPEPGAGKTLELARRLDLARKTLIAVQPAALGEFAALYRAAAPAAELLVWPDRKRGRARPSGARSSPTPPPATGTR